jgi:hypothetical protein
MVEKVPAMDVRRGAPSFRVKRIGSIRPAGQFALSNWTTRPVQSDRTDIPNLGRPSCPGGGLRRAPFGSEPQGRRQSSREHRGQKSDARMSKEARSAKSEIKPFVLRASDLLRHSDFVLCPSRRWVLNARPPLPALAHAETGYFSFNRNSACLSR